MIRVIAAIVALPILLTALLTFAMSGHDLLGSLSVEIFELGLLPLLVWISVAMVLAFLPLVLLLYMLARLSWWNTTAAGFLSALLPLVVSHWSALTDSTLRFTFRTQILVDSYAWLMLGICGGFMFWLLAVFRNRTLLTDSIP